jgi:hypothetical protein
VKPARKFDSKSLATLGAERLAAMVLSRHAKPDGDQYEILSATADALETKRPLAATLALRAMIDFALKEGRTKRYPHAARHLAACGDLAKRMADFAPHPDHDAHIAALKAKHGRKTGFWNN